MTHYTVKFSGSPPDTWNAALREIKYFWDNGKYDRIVDGILTSATEFLGADLLLYDEEIGVARFLLGIEIALSFGGVQGFPARVMGAVCILALEGGPKYRYKL